MLPVPITEHDRLPTCSGVYVIRNRVTGDSYIGATANLQTRIRGHHFQLRERYHTRPFQGSFDQHGAGAFECAVLELCDVDSLNRRELFWFGVIAPTLNMRRPSLKTSHRRVMEVA